LELVKYREIMATKNILIVTKNLPPQVGGIERLTCKTIEVLSKEFNCTVIGPKESKVYVDKYCKYIVCNSNNLLLFFFECIYKSIFISYKNKFDISYAASGLMGPVIYIASIFSKSKCVTYIHGLDIAAENYIYKKVFVPSILASDFVLTNSENTSKLIQNKGYKKSILVINPGVEIPDINKDDSESFKRNYSLDNKITLLTVGRLVKRKGVAEFILNSLPIIAKKYPNIIYVVIGCEASNAVAKESSVKERILSSIQESNMENYVFMIDKVSEEELMSAYNSAHVFVFPLLESLTDIEGFGMVAAEAAAAGLNTVAFDVGGVSDAVLEGETGSLISPQDYNSMTKRICMYLEKENSYMNKLECQKHAKVFSWCRYEKEIVNAFLRIK